MHNLRARAAGRGAHRGKREGREGERMTASISAGPPLRLSVPPKLVAPRQLTDARGWHAACHRRCAHPSRGRQPCRDLGTRLRPMAGTRRRRPCRRLRRHHRRPRTTRPRCARHDRPDIVGAPCRPAQAVPGAVGRRRRRLAARPAVRARIGYPGQRRDPARLEEAADQISDGILDPVLARGPIYTPDATS